MPLTPLSMDPSQQFSDPEAQQKIAENVLNQLGLHPNQLGAKSLLDGHFQSPEAVPEVKSVVQPPLIHGNPTQTEPMSGVSNPPNNGAVTSIENPKSTSTPAASTTPTTPTLSSLAPSNSAQPATVTPTPTAPRIPLPMSGPGITTGNRLEKDQEEYNRLIDTGSGIHQIKNPWLRGLATAGEIGGQIVAPKLMASIPGTDPHHERLINNETGRIGKDLEQAEKESVINKNVEDTNQLENKPFNPTELGTWVQQNPGKPLSQFWKEKSESQFGKLTPQEQVMKYMTSSPDEGGLGLTPDEAFKHVNDVIAGSKPQTTEQQKSSIEALIGKTMPNGQLDPKMMTNPDALINHIAKSDQLTPDQKSQVYSYLLLTSTPASQAGVASTRSNAYMLSRLTPVIDRDSGQLMLVNPEQSNANPGKFIPATQGQAAMSKQAAFSDIDFNTQNVVDAINGLQNGFDAPTRAQFLLAMRSNDPERSFNQFVSSEVAQNLAPDQIDYLTAVAALNENALALRSIQGLGQGSDELRSAITKLVPGPGTPNKDYALRQMELFKGTVERARQGVPITNIKHPPLGAPKSTSEIDKEGQEKTLTRDQVQQQVDTYNQVHPDKKITFDDAVKDAQKHGYKVNNGTVQ